MKLLRSLEAALSTALLVDVALAATAGKLSILSMNVAGLPAILNSNDVPGDKTTNAETIGSKFAEYDYDVIHVQEDFNYHAAIYRTDNHPFRTATSGGVPFGSGLNTLSKLDWVQFERVKWATCSDASSSDCLTPKGFTFMRAAISAGAADNTTAVYVDFYNLHADAGTESGDNVARQANINQVASYIAASSQGNAVLIYGDTNSRYSRAADTAIRSLVASTSGTSFGMRDAWVELQRGGVVPSEESLCANPSSNYLCETVDKVFYRSSPLVTLKAETFQYVSSLFLQADGNVLSDHNPVSVNITWSSGPSLRQSAFWGGPHGTWFSDVSALANVKKPKPSVLSFRGGARLDSVSLTLTDGTRLTHGGTGGSATSITLGASEYWVEARLCQGQRSGQTRNFYIQASTTSGRTLAAGTATQDCATFSAPSGWHIVGFLGQAGDELDQLAFVYAPK
ncbi:Endonuclease/exonuclease/phosphatase [Lasiosphaeria miniovina]|uniref:Endonuclease/exonuclease/phosphatase n=1 Tax=Lasiosphaeria miniovina TaxID=1954250 RepID=A0AA39ZYP9_9PEZI|nr:Endonuclease/exonuclease/phosphatase [Lasiosphaeria miniovina]KAK0706058.1 Endonuclease/exonuclease/phosphatase [Lasiosphaeria miniovina]